MCPSPMHIILSSFIPTTSIPNSKYTLKNFRLTLATKLIGTYCSRKRPGRPKSIVTHNYVTTLPSPKNGCPALAQSPCSLYCIFIHK